MFGITGTYSDSKTYRCSVSNQTTQTCYISYVQNNNRLDIGVSSGSSKSVSSPQNNIVFIEIPSSAKIIDISGGKQILQGDSLSNTKIITIVILDILNVCSITVK